MLSFLIRFLLPIALEKTLSSIPRMKLANNELSLAIFAKRVTDNVDDAEVSLLKEYNKRDPEYVIWYGELKGVIHINGAVLIF